MWNLRNFEKCKTFKHSEPGVNSSAAFRSIGNSALYWDQSDQHISVFHRCGRWMEMGNERFPRRGNRSSWKDITSPENPKNRNTKL